MNRFELRNGIWYALVDETEDGDPLEATRWEEVTSPVLLEALDSTGKDAITESMVASLGEGTPGTITNLGEETSLDQLAAEYGFELGSFEGEFIMDQVLQLLQIVAADRSLNKEPRYVTLDIEGSPKQTYAIIPGVPDPILMAPAPDGFSISFDEDIQKWIVIDRNGNLRLVDKPVTATPGIPSTIEIEGTDHVIHSDGAGKTYVIPKTKAEEAENPFELGDILNRENQAGEGYQFIETAPGSFTLLGGGPEEEFTPATVTEDSSGYLKVTQPDGRVELVPKPAEVFEPGFLDDQNQYLFRQRTGDVTQFRGPQIDDMITQSLIDGDYERAFAFQDFRDRPSAESELKLRLEFARSPADQQIISEIARGVTTVQQDFDPLNPRRIGSQPDFLVEGFNDYLARTRMGRPPTQDEAATLLERLRTGKSPKDDEIADLQQQLEDQAADFKKQMNDQATSFKQQQREQYIASEKSAFEQRQKVAEEKTTELGAEAAAWDAAATHLRELLAAGGDNAAGGSMFTDTGLTDVDTFTKTPTNAEGANVPSDTQTYAGPLDLGSRLRAEEIRQTGSSMVSAPVPVASPTVPIEKDVSPRGGGGGRWDQLLPGYGAPPEGYTPTIRGFAGGGITQGSQFEVVGEEGPELVDLAPGSRVIPIMGLSKAEANRLKKQGFRGLQTGGIVFPGAGNLPFGLRQLQAGRAIEPSRARLLRAANLQLPSAQALQNLTPESVDIFADLAAQAGIPSGALAQEMQTAIPGGARLPIGQRRPRSFAGIL
jgi:hypothetical protein